MRCLADFIVDSDLCLEDGADSLVLTGRNESISLTLSNAVDDHDHSEAVLSAQLVFEADSFENIREIAIKKLMEILSCLAFTTNRKFSLTLLKRIVDWTPGLVEREAIVYVESPVWDGPESGLDIKFAQTAARLLAMQSGEVQRSALRWYRIGLEAENLEEQFSYFWFALEIAAESLKSNEKIQSKCPVCEEPLYCNGCQKHPMHRPFPNEAIDQTIQRVHPNGADEVSKALRTIRHALMHGKRIGSVIDELPCDKQGALNELAWITWQAIYLMFTAPDPCPEEPFNFGYVDNLVRRTIVAGAHIKTAFGGDPNDPQLADFPTVELSVERAPETT